MKIAVLADVHGNVVALDAVLSVLDVERPDRVVLLGDVAAKGPAPAHVIDRLMARDWIFIMGNTDEWMLRPVDEEPSNERERKVIESARWGYEQLNDEQRAFIAGFRATAAIDTPGGTLLCYHGSPNSNRTSILPDSPEAVLAEELGPFPARVYAGAHTHVRMLRPHGDALVINPGSVGMATERLPSGEERLVRRAEFAFFDADESGLRVDFRQLALDESALVDSVRASSSPDAAWWIDGWSR